MHGSDLLDIVGGGEVGKVVGVLNKTGFMAELKDMATKREKFSHYFFLHVLVEAINTLPETTHSRLHNLTQQSAHCQAISVFT